VEGVSFKKSGIEPGNTLFACCKFWLTGSDCGGQKCIILEIKRGRNHLKKWLIIETFFVCY